MQAPVRVARSTMASGLPSLAMARASANTRRPSASVLSTSMVLPFRMVSTSPGRVASPPNMLSVIGMYARTRHFGARAGRTDMVPTTAAAPAMSFFMSIIPLAGLMERPPESKVIPLPTRAMVPVRRAAATPFGV